MRDTPGTSAAAWAIPRTSPSTAVASPRSPLLRPPVGEEHRAGAGEEAVGRRPRAAEPLLDRPLEGVADDRRRQEREGQEQRPAGVETAQLLGDQAPLPDQERGRRAGMERDLEALADLGIELVPFPAGEPGDEDDVGRARDRQQLGGPLDGSERERAGGGEAAVGAPAQAPLFEPAGSGSRRPAPAADQEVGDQPDHGEDDGVVEVLEVVAATVPSCRRPRGRSGPAPGPRGCNRPACRVKRQKGIFAMPAGSEMKVRTIGTIRAKKTVALP